METGILQPNLEYRFRVEMLYNFSEEARFALTRQTVNCKMNYFKKTVSIDIEQAQSLPDIHELVCDNLVGTLGKITIITPLYKLFLLNCQCVDHTFNFDYAGDSACVHNLKFTFTGVNTKMSEDPSMLGQPVKL